MIKLNHESQITTAAVSYLRRCAYLLLIAVLALLLVGCGGDDQPQVSDLAAKLTQEASGAPGIAAVAGDNSQPAASVEAPVEAPAEAPAEPVEAPTEPVEAPAQDDALAAAGATATARFQEIQATSDAAAAGNQAAEAATTEALVPFMEEVARYGVDPTGGRLAWQHPPITLVVTDFEDAASRNQFILTPAKDFVMVADITWNSAYAESGCGFIMRSDGDEENPNQYFVGLTRGAEGHVLFGEQVNGKVNNDEVTDIYARTNDPQFQWQNDTTNRMAVVAQGQEFTIFSNGHRLGKIVAKSGFEEGFVSFIAVNRSGGIKCDFNNAWLWKMEG